MVMLNKAMPELTVTLHKMNIIANSIGSMRAELKNSASTLNLLIHLRHTLEKHLDPLLAIILVAFHGL
jgi:hypothetical protein